MHEQRNKKITHDKKRYSMVNRAHTIPVHWVVPCVCPTAWPTTDDDAKSACRQNGGSQGNDQSLAAIAGDRGTRKGDL
jgi:hypothetical protein